jgi:hypothetical protein
MADPYYPYPTPATSDGDTPSSLFLHHIHSFIIIPLKTSTFLITLIDKLIYTIEIFNSYLGVNFEGSIIKKSRVVVI